MPGVVSLHRVHSLIIFLFSVFVSASDEGVAITFTNVSEEIVKLHYLTESTPADSLGVDVGDVNPGDSITLISHVGHKLTHMSGGKMEVLTVEGQGDFIIGPKIVHVKCATTSGDIIAKILPEWSPRGAARFLHLVRLGYYDGCGVNRVVPKFLAQFGISADREARARWSGESILDDPFYAIASTYEPGFLSFAGSGPNSRTTEIFVVMPDAPGRQLDNFGLNSWETPFGYVISKYRHVVKDWYSYGDMEPWGEGPDPKKVYSEDGYDYLKTQYPKLSYIEECHIIPYRDDLGSEL